jgi:hypothetical protein
MTSDSMPVVDINASSATTEAEANNLYKNWGYVYNIESSDDKLTLYAWVKPDVVLNILIKGY